MTQLATHPKTQFLIYNLVKRQWFRVTIIPPYRNSLRNFITSTGSYVLEDEYEVNETSLITFNSSHGTHHEMVMVRTFLNMFRNSPYYKPMT